MRSSPGYPVKLFFSAHPVSEHDFAAVFPLSACSGNALYWRVIAAAASPHIVTQGNLSTRSVRNFAPGGNLFRRGISVRTQVLSWCDKGLLHIRRLAHLDPTDAPVLSIYLDMRPHGTEPALRPALTYLKERLRAIEKTLWPRGVAYDSVRADAVRIARYLDDVPADVQGVALFTCAAGDLFETVAVGVPFENQVVAAPVPDLFQLARLAEKAGTQDAAQRVPNVRDVANTIVVKLPRIGTPTDMELAQAVRTALELTEAVPHQRIRSTVSNGWVMLHGMVDQRSQREIDNPAGIRTDLVRIGGHKERRLSTTNRLKQAAHCTARRGWVC
jgi:BON domain